MSLTNNKTYLGLHVKCPYFSLIFTKYEISLQIFTEVPSLKFHISPSSWGLVHADELDSLITILFEERVFMAI